MNMLIPFGKHKGCYIYDVIKRDYNYCRWLADQRIFKEDSEIGQFLERQFGLERCRCGAGLLIRHKCDKR
jgi:uncharacterized protein (DUF3820 family)